MSSKCEALRDERMLKVCETCDNEEMSVLGGCGGGDERDERDGRGVRGDVQTLQEILREQRRLYLEGYACILSASMSTHPNEFFGLLTADKASGKARDFGCHHTARNALFGIQRAGVI